MQSLLFFADIMKTLGTLGQQIDTLRGVYESFEERTPIDDALIDQFLAQSALLVAATEALKTTVYTPQEEPSP